MHASERKRDVRVREVTLSYVAVQSESHRRELEIMVRVVLRAVKC